MRKLKRMAALALVAAVLGTQNLALALKENPGMTICYDGAEHWYTGSVYDLYVNGEAIYSPMEPIIFNDHAVVPVREVFEACGATVNYDMEKLCVEIQYGYNYIRVYINDNTAYVNGKRFLIPDNVVPKLIYKPNMETKTMVPVRFISEAAGMVVDFDGETGGIYIKAYPAVNKTERPTEAPTDVPEEPPKEDPTAEPTAEPTPLPTAVVTVPTAAPVVQEPEETELPTPAPTPVVLDKKDSQGRMPTMTGIDVSEHQGTIDWEALVGEIDFAILRCGYGSDIESQDDKMWERNVSECERLGIPYGVYLYSYANSTEKAASEAEHVLRLLKGHTPAMPVFYDMEDKIQAAVSNEERAEYAKIFCEAVSAAGYEVGIYANKNWWTNYLTEEIFDNESWHRWVAQYSTGCTYPGKYVMWQYADNGSYGGNNIDKNFDMNFWYGDVRR